MQSSRAQKEMKRGSDEPQMVPRSRYASGGSHVYQKHSDGNSVSGKETNSKSPLMRKKANLALHHRGD